jgi:hypothetical protein
MVDTVRVLALSAVVFGLAWWLGLYLAARDPRKPVLLLAAAGLVGYALTVAVEALRLSTSSEALGRVELYLACIPGLAWLGVLLELADRTDGRRIERAGQIGGLAVVVALLGALLAGRVGGPIRLGHWLLLAAIAGPLLAALVLAVRRHALRPTQVRGVLAVSTLFFALGVAVLLLPFGLVPSWLALASIGFDLVLLGLAVALWDAFDEGQALRADMLRSLVAAVLVGALFGGQVGIVLAATGRQPWVVALLFGSVAAAITVQVLAGPLAAALDRLAFARSPKLRSDRAQLRETADALPRLAPNAIPGLDDEEFVRLTRRALSHYGDLSRLVASPLNNLPVIDTRLAARGAPDQPLERATELKQLLAESIQRLKPREGGEFGTSDEWRFYNALYFPYVAGVRAYSQRATAAGLDPVARQAWQWFATSVPQRSLHNWQNAAARLVAADLRARWRVDA